ncbi:hypothetical protein [Chryseobacterium sp.]|uniref:hypothetical protein n=1 Tax=Chryseobacterium sp. TaxID=1871047 RepID=UPI002FCA71DE
MSNNKTVIEAKNMRSQLRTIINLATNLEAEVEAFLDGVGAVQDKQISKTINNDLKRKIEVQFHNSLKVRKK